MVKRPRVLKPPDIALEPGEQLVRLTWPAGRRRLRSRSRWATLRTSDSQRFTGTNDVRYIYRYHPDRPWNRYAPSNRWVLDRQIRSGEIRIDIIWQPPYAVSSGL